MAAGQRAGKAAICYKPYVSIFGCQLTEDVKEYHWEVEEEGTEQITLRSMCLDANVSKEMHIVKMDALDIKGNRITVQLGALKPDVLHTVNLGGYELTDPVTFRLTSGSGPVYISGQHFIGEEESEEEEVENGSSPIKKPSKPLLNSRETTKKMKFKNVSVSSSEDSTDEDETSGEVYVIPHSSSEPCVISISSGEDSDVDTDSESSSGSGSSSDSEEKEDHRIPANIPNKDPNVGVKRIPSLGPKPPVSVPEVKVRLKTMVEKAGNVPTRWPQFVNYLRHSFRVEDPTVVRQLWNYRQSLPQNQNTRNIKN